MEKKSAASKIAFITNILNLVPLHIYMLIKLYFLHFHSPIFSPYKYFLYSCNFFFFLYAL